MATDFAKTYGGPILSYVETTLGPILNPDRPFSINPKAQVKAYLAQVRSQPEYNVLFTIGLFAHHMKECFICLPSAWPLPHYYFQQNLLKKNLTDAPHLPETLPLDILTAATAAALRKNTRFVIDEGTFLDKSKSPWSKYQWPEGLLGMTIVDYYWTPESQESHQIDEDTVQLFALAPVSDKNATIPRHGSWQQLALPLFADIHLLSDMNQAILERNWERAAELVTAGVNINRGVYDRHPQWGDIMTYTCLEYVMMCPGALDMAKLLVGSGAKISPEALPLIAHSGDMDMFEYFLSLGCDINAVDNVGYTALNRALAFHWQPMVQRLVSLGGKYMVQRHDSTDRLAELAKMGIALDYSGL